jgi:hypothetical protein
LAIFTWPFLNWLKTVTPMPPAMRPMIASTIITSSRVKPAAAARAVVASAVLCILEFVIALSFAVIE